MVSSAARPSSRPRYASTSQQLTMAAPATVLICFSQDEHELLARGSAFLLGDSSSPEVFALFCAHVAAPHRYRQYFPEDWLQFVRDEHCLIKLENVRSPSPQFASESPEKAFSLDEVRLVDAYRHASLDVAAYTLPRERVCAEEGINASQVQLLQLAECSAGDEVVVKGHVLVGDAGSGSEHVCKTELEGVVAFADDERAFVDTGHGIAQMGMCGGPVVLKDSPSKCVGMLEGILQRQGETSSVSKGQSVVIHAKQLDSFLKEMYRHTNAAKDKAS